MDPNCLFCKIVAGQVPSKKVYEDDKVFVFEDINPQAPTHVLIIPKKHLVSLKEAKPEDAEIIGYCNLIKNNLVLIYVLLLSMPQISPNRDTCVI